MTEQAAAPGVPFRAARRGKERTKMRGFLQKAVSWMGIAVIAVLAIPAGALILLIVGVWSLTDRLVSRLARREQRP